MVLWLTLWAGAIAKHNVPKFLRTLMQSWVLAVAFCYRYCFLLNSIYSVAKPITAYSSFISVILNSVSDFSAHSVNMLCAKAP